MITDPSQPVWGETSIAFPGFRGLAQKGLNVRLGNCIQYPASEVQDFDDDFDSAIAVHTASAKKSAAEDGRVSLSMLVRAAPRCAWIGLLGNDDFKTYPALLIAHNYVELILVLLDRPVSAWTGPTAIGSRRT